MNLKGAQILPTDAPHRKAHKEFQREEILSIRLQELNFCKTLWMNENEENYLNNEIIRNKCKLGIELRLCHMKIRKFT